MILILPDADDSDFSDAESASASSDTDFASDSPILV
jgi:hypothetical protein